MNALHVPGVTEEERHEGEHLPPPGGLVPAGVGADYNADQAPLDAHDRHAVEPAGCGCKILVEEAITINEAGVDRVLAIFGALRRRRALGQVC